MDAVFSCLSVHTAACTWHGRQRPLVLPSKGFQGPCHGNFGTPGTQDQARMPSGSPSCAHTAPDPVRVEQSCSWVSLPIAGGLEPDLYDLYGPAQPKPFCDLSPTLLLTTCPEQEQLLAEQTRLCPLCQPKAWEGAGGAIPLLWKLWLCRCACSCL